ncbi:hypothetical protein EJD97_010418 [Solanum chilense]|uniref:Uncharacterized protein n=1 Tax=Solanum chilense TaxID=4083 RepID=A0A6N2AGE6_SOLCI|nr:hypothetical protein EJD97_010418 [Solanum chilense]
MILKKVAQIKLNELKIEHQNKHITQLKHVSISIAKEATRNIFRIFVYKKFYPISSLPLKKHFLMMRVISHNICWQVDYQYIYQT